MKKLTAVLVLLAFVPLQLLAWAPTGHAIVADLAYARLTATTRQNVRILLGDATLASIASWADEVRPQRQETYNWHFVDIPKDAPGFSSQRDCFLPNDTHPNAKEDHHNCVVDRIGMFKQILADKNATRDQRVEALKFLVHFVGDIHQPMHAVGEARGGNDVKLPIFGSPQCGNYICNLHWAWDGALIDHSGYSEEQYVQHVEELIRAKNLASRAGGTPAEWADESFRAAWKAWPPAGGSIDEAYYRANIGVVDERLALAGIRLAAMLNEALGTISPEQMKDDLARTSGGSARLR